jgi:hypothetical protein
MITVFLLLTAPYRGLRPPLQTRRNQFTNALIFAAPADKVGPTFGLITAFQGARNFPIWVEVQLLSSRQAYVA